MEESVDQDLVLKNRKLSGSKLGYIQKRMSEEYEIDFESFDATVGSAPEPNSKIYSELDRFVDVEDGRIRINIEQKRDRFKFKFQYGTEDPERAEEFDSWIDSVLEEYEREFEREQVSEPIRIGRYGTKTLHNFIHKLADMSREERLEMGEVEPRPGGRQIRLYPVNMDQIDDGESAGNYGQIIGKGSLEITFLTENFEKASASVLFSDSGMGDDFKVEVDDEHFGMKREVAQQIKEMLEESKQESDTDLGHKG